MIIFSVGRASRPSFGTTNLTSEDYTVALDTNNIIDITYGDLYLNITDYSCFPPTMVDKPFELKHTKGPGLVLVKNNIGGAFTLDLETKEDDVLVFRVMNPGFTDFRYHARETPSLSDVN